MIKTSLNEMNQVNGGIVNPEVIGRTANTVQTKTITCPNCKRYYTHIYTEKGWVCTNCYKVNPKA